MFSLETDSRDISEIFYPRTCKVVEEQFGAAIVQERQMLAGKRIAAEAGWQGGVRELRRSYE